MTSAYLIPDLERDEDVKFTAYPDPLTHGAPWTIGCGHTGREVHPGLVWDMAQVLSALDSDIAAAEHGLDTALPWWRSLSDLRQDCLVNQAFNMGVGGLVKFTTYLGLVRHGNYAAAAEDEMHTLWAKQVGARAQRLADQMRTNLHAGVTAPAIATSTTSMSTSLAPASAPAVSPLVPAAIPPVVGTTPQGQMTAPDFTPTPIELPSQVVAQLSQLGTHGAMYLLGILGTAGVTLLPGDEAKIAAVGGSLAVALATIAVNAALQYLRHKQAVVAVAAAKAS